jgi:hypothetical protein
MIESTPYNMTLSVDGKLGTSLNNQISENSNKVTIQFNDVKSLNHKSLNHFKCEHVVHDKLSGPEREVGV